MMRTALRFLGTAGLSAVLGTGYWYRPLPLHESDQADRAAAFASARRLTDYKDRDLPLHVKVSQQVVLFFGVSLSRAFLTWGGEFFIVPDDNYRRFLRQVVHRESERPLITVSNHRSLLDDPTILSSLLPYWLNVQPRYVRHSICAQEYCFNDKLGHVLHGIVGLGKVVPIKRGAGISQRLFREISEIVEKGNWLHVFPEGGIWQLDGLGGRKDPSTKGKLKWGIGRLIAHSTVTPLVQAFYFSGMESIMPHDHETKTLLVKYPQIGHKVKVIFGDNMQFQDLIDEHEKAHGKLWKFSDDRDLVEMNWYNPSPQELELYSKITTRVERELHSLYLQLEDRSTS